MADVRPPLTFELVWSDELRFEASLGAVHAMVDGAGKAGPSPTQYAALGLAGCMAADVADILRKGRHPFTGLRVGFTGTRAETPPRRFTAIALRFTIDGAVPVDAVERAIALSRERYCSVWHSFRQDIVLSTSVDVRP